MNGGDPRTPRQQCNKLKRKESRESILEVIENKGANLQPLLQEKVREYVHESVWQLGLTLRLYCEMGGVG